jgi:hypothetical protein
MDVAIRAQTGRTGHVVKWMTIPTGVYSNYQLDCICKFADGNTSMEISLSLSQSQIHNHVIIPTFTERKTCHALAYHKCFMLHVLLFTDKHYFEQHVFRNHVIHINRQA